MPKRKRIRLKVYDYSKEGFYFITICTKNRKRLLSTIIEGGDKTLIRLTHIGQLVKDTYTNLEKEFKNIKLHDYVIMPNHIHGIIELQRADTRPAPTIGNVICSFKSRTTVQALKNFKFDKTLNGKLWQRNYYEHIIRNDKEYYLIIEYINNNIFNWNKDKYFI